MDDSLIQGLATSDENYIIASLRNIQSSDIRSFNIAKLQSLLYPHLQSQNLTIASMSLSLYSHLLHSLPKDSNAQVQNVIQRSVEFLGQLRPDVHRAAKDALLKCIRLPGKIETVIGQLQELGMNHSSWHIRQQTCKALTYLLEEEPKFMQNTYEVKRLYETILKAMDDTSALVQLSARDTIRHLDQLNPNHNDTVKRLPYPLQKIYSENNDNFFLDQMAAKKAEQNRTSRFQQQRQSDSALNQYPKDPDGQVFGFIGENTMRKATEKNWRQRVTGVSDMEKTLVGLKRDFTKIITFLPPFFEYCKELLSENNFKMTVSVLNMITELANFPTIGKTIDLSSVFDLLTAKLGENRISVRKAASTTYQAVIKGEEPMKVFGYLSNHLKNQNWHIREEVLQLFIAALLAPNQNINYDFVKLVMPIAQLLDDDKAKVKFVATETLAVLASKYGQELISSILSPVVDFQAYSAIQDRFTNPILPILRDTTVDFPRIIPPSVPTFSISSPVVEPPVIEDAIIKRKASRPKNESAIIERQSTITSQNSTVSTRASLSRGINPRKIEEKAAASSIFSTSTSFGHREAFIHDEQESPKLTREMNHTTTNFGKQVSTERVKGRALSTALSVDNKRSLANETTYLTLEQIMPYENPEQDLMKIIGSLKSCEWVRQFEAINSLRRLVVHHSFVLKDFNIFRNIISEISSLIASLRSSLSKNALILLNDIATYMPKSLDQELTFLLPKVMKKWVDASSFLSDEAEAALYSIARNCTGNRVVACLLNIANSSEKSIKIKAKIAMWFAVLIDKLGGQVLKLKNLGPIVNTLSTLLDAASALVRNTAKQAICSLGTHVNKTALDKILQSTLNDRQLQKMANVAYDVSVQQPKVVREAPKTRQPRSSTNTGERLNKRLNSLSPEKAPTLDVRSSWDPTLETSMVSDGKDVLFRRKPLQVLTKSLDRSVPGTPKGRTTPRSAQLRNKSLSYTQQAPDYDDQIERLSEALEAKEWKTRYEAVHEISKLASINPGAIKNFERVMSCFALGLSDINIKVNIHSLSALIRIIPLYKTHLDTHISQLIVPLGISLGSPNSSIRSMSKNVIDILMSNWPPVNLITPLLNAALVSNNRGKPIILNIMASMLPIAYKTKPNVINKQWVAGVMKLQGEKKAEVRVAVTKLLGVMYNTMGATVVELMPASKLQFFLDFVNKH